MRRSSKREKPERVKSKGLKPTNYHRHRWLYFLILLIIAFIVYILLVHGSWQNFWECGIQGGMCK